MSAPRPESPAQVASAEEAPREPRLRERRSGVRKFRRQSQSHEGLYCVVIRGPKRGPGGSVLRSSHRTSLSPFIETIQVRAPESFSTSCRAGWSAVAEPSVMSRCPARTRGATSNGSEIARSAPKSEPVNEFRSRANLRLIATKASTRGFVAWKSRPPRIHLGSSRPEPHAVGDHLWGLRVEVAAVLTEGQNVGTWLSACLVSG